MPLPNLLHPLTTDFQSFDPDNTIQDDGYNEPVQTVSYGEKFSVPGQWKWFSSGDLRMQKYGAEEGEDGYVLVRPIDLRSIGKEIKRGDRIIGYGSGVARYDLDVYVVRVRPEGHYPSLNGPGLLKVFFSDRQPERQNPGNAY